METEIQVKKKVEISREDFEDYESVRKSGATNMFDVQQVINLSNNLTREKCLAIMKNYNELVKEFEITERGAD